MPKCKTINTAFIQSSEGHNSSLTATALFSRFDRNRWIDSLKQFKGSTIDLLVEKHVVYGTLIGRTQHFPHHSPISAGAVASQLLKNRRNKAADCKST